MRDAEWVNEIKKRLNELADRVQFVVDRSLKAFFSGDKTVAREVIEHEDLLDRLEVQLEEHAISILEKEKPEGYYLRFLVSALKINSDLERMGDLAVDICHVTLELGRIDQDDFPPLLRLMIDRARHLHTNGLKSMMNEDIGVALQVRGEDVVIDRYAREITSELAERGMADPVKVPRLLQILIVVRSVERIADLATNIAEDIIYLVEGTIVRHTY
jgi:phosphate transport system protein